jgi:transcription elongation GreA/GreB family factor
MSRAFVKEDAGGPPVLPDLPISPHPNYVTPSGLAELRTRLAARTADLAALRARPDRLDLMPEAAAERDIRYLEARLASAIPVETGTHPGDEVAFGLWVEVEDEAGRKLRFRIVGEDEAAADRGLIAPTSPLARALLGARVGDSVTWPRPAGAIALDITGIHHDRADHPPA